MDNWVNSGIWNDRVTPPIKKVKNGKTNKIPREIYKTGICLPNSSLCIFAYLEVKIIKHKIDEDNLNKGYLTWLCRSLMEKQKNDYEYFMYLEHDIKFSENNLQYWQKYQKNLAEKKFHLGFLIYEKNNLDNQNYSVHIAKKLDSYL